MISSSSQKRLKRLAHSSPGVREVVSTVPRGVDAGNSLPAVGPMTIQPKTVHWAMGAHEGHLRIPSLRIEPWTSAPNRR